MRLFRKPTLKPSGAQNSLGLRVGGGRQVFWKRYHRWRRGEQDSSQERGGCAVVLAGCCIARYCTSWGRGPGSGSTGPLRPPSVRGTVDTAPLCPPTVRGTVDTAPLPFPLGEVLWTQHPCPLPLRGTVDPAPLSLPTQRGTMNTAPLQSPLFQAPWTEPLPPLPPKVTVDRAPAPPPLSGTVDSAPASSHSEKQCEPLFFPSYVFEI